MAVVNIRINGRDYQVACDDGQEEHLRLLADDIDERVRALVFGMKGNPGEALSLLLTALTMADEQSEFKKETERLAAEVRRLRALVDDEKKQERQNRMAEMETAMAVTLDEIALRIEKIAQQIEIRD
jgi:cell division protein ZapA